MMDTVTYQAGTSGLVGAGLLETLRISPGDGLAQLFQACIMYACLAALLILAVIAFACVCRRAFVLARRVLSRGEMVAFVLAAGVCCWAAQKRLVRFPRTDPTTDYLIDNGSYVDSETNLLHIDFRRFIVPDNAPLFIDKRVREDGAEWENMVSETFADVPLPYETTIENATNYEFAVYTTWTPGPSVQTNGVWHANWGRDTSGRFILPIRTEVREGGKIIASPKSKKEQELNDEVE